jgi:hypothetical protein
MWLPTGTGTFEAMGPAVEAGIVCPAGTVTDSNVKPVGWQSDQVLILFVHKQFVCNDGSGSFDMDLNVRIAPTGTTARWIIVGGDGSYANLSGNGGLTATGGDVPGLLIDTYTGKMHAVPAVAAAPADVTILSEMSLSSGTGTFEASGPAVEAGILCPEGSVNDDNISAVGWQSNQVLILFVHKHFACNDGSGSFEMDLNVRIAPTGTTARWIVVAGDGNYERLAGNGGLVATAVSEVILIDTYSGKMHVK